MNSQIKIEIKIAVYKISSLIKKSYQRYLKSSSDFKILNLS